MTSANDDGPGRLIVTTPGSLAVGPAVRRWRRDSNSGRWYEWSGQYQAKDGACQPAWLILRLAALKFIAAGPADSLKEDGINFEILINASTWPAGILEQILLTTRGNWGQAPNLGVTDGTWEH